LLLQNEGAWLHQLEEPGTCGIVEHSAVDLGIARIGAYRAGKALAVQHVQLHEPKSHSSSFADHQISQVRLE
jgi:hypothetical protein